MVLGFILYETFDVLYHAGSMTYNGTSYLYNWYYGIKDESTLKENEVKLLKMRIEDLERRLLADRSGENHKTTKEGKEKHKTN